MTVDRPAAGPGPEDGSATVWVLAAATLVLVVLLSGAVRTGAVLARHRLERTADLAALAGAERIGRDGLVCPAVARIAQANRAQVLRCEVQTAAGGRSGSVRVVLRAGARLPVVGGVVLTARSRAGRLPPTRLPASPGRPAVAP